MPLEIAKLARELFQRNYDWKEPVRSVTVRAINLVSAKEPEQICLFSDPIRLEKEEKLFLAIEEIRRRFGKRAIYPAALMKDHSHMVSIEKLRQRPAPHHMSHGKIHKNN